MSQLEKLKQEEAELEAQLTQKLGDPVEPTATTVEDGIQITPEEKEAAEFIQEIVIPPAQDTPEQPAPVKRTNWKKRFTGYKASSDATIYEQRQELEALRAQMVNLSEQLVNSQDAKREVQGEDMFKDAFTDDEVDTFGADGLDVVKKVTKVAIDNQVKPLKAQLAKAELDRLKSMKLASENELRSSYNKFTIALESLVPDYKDLNADPGFLEWIKQPDEHSGLPRISLLRNAESKRDVKRTSDFFIEFKAAQTPNIEKYITPIGSGSTPRPQQKPDQPVYKQSDIDKFYSDVMKGRYKGQQDLITSTERAIEQASVDKRILYGQ